MRVLLLLLAPVMGYSQFIGNLAYKNKEVHSITYINDSTTNWKIDTINYSVPFEIKYLSDGVYGMLLNKDGVITGWYGGKLQIDGYGTFKVDSIKQKYNSPYWNYWLKGGKQFSLIENIGYLNYPTINKKSQIIIFYID